HTVMKTLVEQSSETAGKLNGTMSALQKSMQDVTANSGARLDTMSTQVQGLSDNLEEIKSRLGQLNQQLVDLQNTVQSIDAKISGGGGTGATPTASNSGGGMSSQPASSSAPPSGAPAGGGSAPPADTLYSNGLRDITGGNYDLARKEFQDYLKFYGDTDLASNAQFYFAETLSPQKIYNRPKTEN